MIKNVTVNGNEVSLTSELTYTIENIDRNYEIRLNCKSLPGVINPEFTAQSIDGFTVVFTNVSWGSPTTWKWNFGDGSTATGDQIYHTYTKA
jgi:PKD repeat protein